jgi:iron(III) transport system substrate-binding protein
MTDRKGNDKLSRRTVLRIAALGAGSSLFGGSVPHRAYAQAAGDVAKAIAWAKTNLPASTPEIITAAAKEGKLTLTLQLHGDDAANTALVKKFNEHYPFVNVSYTLQTSTQVMQKFSAELNAKRVLSDYIHLPSDLQQSNKYIESGAIAQFVISQDAAFPDKAKRRGIWYPWFRQHGVTAYRVGAVSAEEKQLLRTFKGLGDPRFKGRLGITAVNNSISVTGSYVLQTDSDPSLWERLVANQPKVKPSSAALTDGLLAGEYDVAIMDGFSTVAQAAKAGAPVELVISNPSPVIYAPGAITAAAPNLNAAKLWQDWAMSKEGQDLWIGMVGTPSARSDIVRPWVDQQPWFWEDEASHRPIDWDAFGKKTPEVVARFKKDIQGG